MSHQSIIVRAEWDDEAEVWVATSSDIEGLAVEAPTLERLTDKITGAVADLIELNGLDYELPEIPVHIVSSQLARVANPHSS